MNKKYDAFMFLIGIDIGGTKCRASLGRERQGELEFIAFGEEHTTAESDHTGMLNLLLEDAKALTVKVVEMAGEKPAAIGISCGGPLDQKQGLILSPPNLPGWDRVPVTEFFSKATGIPAFLLNDADAGALAEWKYGAGKGVNSLIFITFGTGLGAGLILDGRLYSGASGMAGEIGHIRLSNYGPPGYGKTGSFEGFCSGGGIVHLARQAVEAELQQGKKPALCPDPKDLEKINARSVGIAAERGDLLAKEIYAEAGKKLGEGLAILIDILNPELIIIGSIFVRSRNELWPYAEELIKKEALQKSREACRVVPNLLGDEIGNYSAITVGKYGLEQNNAVSPGKLSERGRPGAEEVTAFDRGKMTYYPLKERLNKLSIAETCIAEESWDHPIPPSLGEKTEQIADEIISAQKKGASVICAFGAHTIKNGLGKLVGEMLEKGWLTHLASNGAAFIHDWEFAFFGKSGEDVQKNAAEGRFGTWQETGLYINLALAVGVFEGSGYGASIGKMIRNNGVSIPEREELIEKTKAFQKGSANEAAAALDLYELVETLEIPSGFLSVPHSHSAYSLLALAMKAARPFTCHPMFGHDIIYTHKANRGAATGRAAEKDFLEYVSAVSALEGGVYLSIGSAVMSPMIFEKALSMARNAAGEKDAIRDCDIHVVDLEESSWDWAGGEPPMDNPAYYHRFMKTFSRMGCRADYTSGDNRDFFVSLYRALKKRAP
jgi:predicted NBD/HSP70 family sugar kinase